MPAEFAILRSPGSDPVAWAKSTQLLARSRKLRKIRRCQMREEIDRTLHPRQPAERRQCLLELGALESEAIHARIELEPDLERRPGTCIAQQFDLLGRVHHELELRGCGGVQLSAVEHALEEHRALADPGIAKRESFVDARHGEGVRRVERPRHANQSVAVCVRLDDRHDARARRPMSDSFEVVIERAGIDRRADHRRHRGIIGASSTAHRNTPSAYDSGA